MHAEPFEETILNQVSDYKQSGAVRTIDWRFTTDDAGSKLDHLSPVLHD